MEDIENELRYSLPGRKWSRPLRPNGGGHTLEPLTTDQRVIISTCYTTYKVLLWDGVDLMWCRKSRMMNTGVLMICT